MELTKSPFKTILCWGLLKKQPDTQTRQTNHRNKGLFLQRGTLIWSHQFKAPLSHCSTSYWSALSEAAWLRREFRWITVDNLCLVVLSGWWHRCLSWNTAGAWLCTWVFFKNIRWDQRAGLTTFSLNTVPDKQRGRGLIDLPHWPQHKPQKAVC